MTNKMAMRYLSPVKTLMKKLDFDEHYIEALDFAIKALEGTQAVWLRDDDTGLIGCSNCHIVWLRGTTAYCPNCGAKMK